MLCVFLQSTRRESFSLDLEMVSLTFSKISFCSRQLLLNFADYAGDRRH